MKPEAGVPLVLQHVVAGVQILLPGAVVADLRLDHVTTVEPAVAWQGGGGGRSDRSGGRRRPDRPAPDRIRRQAVLRPARGNKPPWPALPPGRQTPPGRHAVVAWIIGTTSNSRSAPVPALHRSRARLVLELDQDREMVRAEGGQAAQIAQEEVRAVEDVVERPADPAAGRVEAVEEAAADARVDGAAQAPEQAAGVRPGDVVEVAHDDHGLPRLGNLAPDQDQLGVARQRGRGLGRARRLGVHAQEQTVSPEGSRTRVRMDGMPGVRSSRTSGSRSSSRENRAMP